MCDQTLLNDYFKPRQFAILLDSVLSKVFIRGALMRFTCILGTLLVIGEQQMERYPASRAALEDLSRTVGDC